MLKGKNIHLRTLEISDTDQILTWENDTNHWRVSGTKVPYSRQIIEAYINSAQDLYAHQQIRLLILEKSSGKAVGTIDVFEFDPLHQRAGLGVLIDQQFREKGYALEALMLIERYLLEVIGVRNLYCNILADNEASIALFEKAGFAKIAIKGIGSTIVVSGWMS
jgi:diamine N-acetyltransferase